MAIDVERLASEVESWSDRLEAVITSTDPGRTFGALGPVELLTLFGNLGALMRYGCMVGAAVGDRLTEIAAEALAG